MNRPRLLDLYCGAGGCSLGYERAGFEVVGVDANPKCECHYRRVCAAKFVMADALEYVREHGHEFDAIHASPPCQAHTSLRALQPGKTYPDLIPATRAALIATGKPYVIENVIGAPLGGGSTYLLLLCGTMFGLVTPDGSAEIQRHRLFECNWCFGLRPACQHGRQVLTVVGHDYHSMSARNARRRTLTVAGEHPHSPATRHAKRRAMSVTGHTPQTNTVRNVERETFTPDEARAAMGIDLPMKYLSQAIPPAYTRWIGARLLAHLGSPNL